MAKTKPVGFAVVGLGDIAQEVVLPAFANAKKNARLVALVSGDDLKLKKLGKRYHVDNTYSYEQFDDCLAHPDVDAVYIALPNTMHAEYAERAARAGVHVLCEKPMATTDADCERMRRAARENDVRLMIAYRLHFDPANLAVVEAIRKGKLGELRSFSSSFGYQVKADNIRTKEDAGGGPIWDLGPYPINAARYLFRAEPLEVFAYGSKGRDARFDAGIHDTVTVIMKFPEDRVAQLTVSFTSEATGDYLVVGTHGAAELKNAYEYRGTRELKLLRKGKAKTRKFKESDQFAPELLYFSDCVLEGKEPEPSGVEGQLDTRIVLAVLESLDTGRPVRIEGLEKAQRPEPSQEIYRAAVKTPPLVNAENPVQG